MGFGEFLCFDDGGLAVLALLEGVQVAGIEPCSCEVGGTSRVRVGYGGYDILVLAECALGAVLEDLDCEVVGRGEVGRAIVGEDEGVLGLCEGCVDVYQFAVGGEGIHLEKCAGES